MFTCFQCAECCKDVVFHVKERKIATRHAGYRGVDPRIIQAFRRGLEYVASDSSNRREHYFLSGQCPFHCGHEGCLIYLSRPFNCRNFICGRRSESEVLEWDGKVCLNQVRRIEADPGYKEYMAGQMSKGREYACAIGIMQYKSTGHPVKTP